MVGLPDGKKMRIYSAVSTEYWRAQSVLCIRVARQKAFNSNCYSRICSEPSIQSARRCITQSVYAVRKRKDFRWRLNVAVNDHMSFSSVGKRFHARGVATENARSPIRRSVLGWKRSPLLQARSEERDGMLVTSVSRFLVQSGGSYMVAWFQIEHESRRRVQDFLQWCQCRRREADEDGVAVIEARQHQGRDQSRRNVAAELSTNRAQTAQVEIICLSNTRGMCCCSLLIGRTISRERPNYRTGCRTVETFSTALCKPRLLTICFIWIVTGYKLVYLLTPNNVLYLSIGCALQAYMTCFYGSVQRVGYSVAYSFLIFLCFAQRYESQTTFASCA